MAQQPRRAYDTTQCSLKKDHLRQSFTGRSSKPQRAHEHHPNRQTKSIGSSGEIKRASLQHRSAKNAGGFKSSVAFPTRRPCNYLPHSFKDGYCEVGYSLAGLSYYPYQAFERPVFVQTILL